MVCAAVVNCQLKRGIAFHDAPHRFRKGWGTGTATLEAKLSQHIYGLAHKPLFRIFIDVHNAYDSLDRVQCIKVLRGYGMGPNPARLLKS